MPDDKPPINLGNDLGNVLVRFQDLFGEFFGMAAGGDVRVDLAISDEEAVSGVTRDVAIKRRVTCVTCDGGGGATPSERREPCKPCDAHRAARRTCRVSSRSRRPAPRARAPR